MGPDTQGVIKSPSRVRNRCTCRWRFRNVAFTVNVSPKRVYVNDVNVF